MHFTPRHHSATFNWRQRKFLESLKPGSKVLEIGAGDARLAHYVLTHSAIRPTNYTLLDNRYGREKVPVFHRIPTASRRQFTRVGGDLFFLPFRGKKLFDKILVPESFLPDMHRNHSRVRIRAKENPRAAEFGFKASDQPVYKISVALLALLRRCVTLLKINGELYISYAHIPFLPKGLNPAGDQLFENLDTMKRKGVIDYEWTSMSGLMVKRLK